MIRIIGAATAALALLVLILSLIALIDARGPMASDSDTLTTPARWHQPAAMAVISLVVAGAGIWVFVRKKDDRGDII